jgi:2-aminoethylphosphonate transport system substrate-binding protein
MRRTHGQLSVIAAAASILAIGVSACGTAAGAAGGSGGSGGSGGGGSVTVYSADGLKTALGPGQVSWFDKEFAAFQKQTGITVRYVEGGSGEVLNRVEAEQSNTQADVLVTLPPFIQKAANDGVLQKLNVPNAAAVPAGAKDPGGRWTSLVGNYLSFLYNQKMVKQAPTTFGDLLAPSLNGQIQYSTPGVAGDGTAFMVAAIHAFGDNVNEAMQYLKKLEGNDVGPSASTGALTTKVIKGEIAVANGDLQMNGLLVQQNPQVKLWLPKDASGRPFTLPLEYAVGLVSHAPDSANGRKLINFLLSQQAQASVSKLSNGLPVRADIHPTDRNSQVNTAALRGVTIWQPDWTSIAKNLTSLVAEYHNATGS